MKYQLKVIKGEAEGKTFVVETDELTIGRVEANALVVFDPGVSRQHAVVRKAGNRMKVMDLGSRNGTFVNGVPIVEEFIDDGDLLAIGSATMRFLTGAGAAGMRISELSTQIIGPSPSKPKAKAAPAPAAKAKPKAGAGSGAGRKVLIAAMIVIIVLAAAAAALMLLKGGVKLARDNSGEVFPLNMTVYEKKFGYGDVDVQCMSKCSFLFGFNGGRAVLSYSATAVASGDEVEISVNGRAVGTVPQTDSSWLRGISLSIPAEALKPGASNTLVFANKRNPSGRATWTVGFVKVYEESLPEPNIEKARSLSVMAYKKYDEKDVAMGNLYQSLVYFRNSRSYMEKQDPRPELYAEVSAKIDSVSRELQELYDKHMFTARKAMQFGDRNRAGEALDKLLKIFPDADDQRHQEARALLEQVRETR
ncbi:MAG: FHA domain-containing protein [Myxococcota bacterium]|jgi:hypothetical protein